MISFTRRKLLSLFAIPAVMPLRPERVHATATREVLREVLDRGDGTVKPRVILVPLEYREAAIATLQGDASARA